MFRHAVAIYKEVVIKGTIRCG